MEKCNESSYCNLSTWGYVRKSGVVASMPKESPSGIFRGPHSRLRVSESILSGEGDSSAVCKRIKTNVANGLTARGRFSRGRNEHTG